MHSNNKSYEIKHHGDTAGKLSTDRIYFIVEIVVVIESEVVSHDYIEYHGQEYLLFGYPDTL